MKNKYDILMYVAAIIGGVLGAYLCAKEYALGAFLILFFCTVYIIGHVLCCGMPQWLNEMQKKRQRRKN